MIPRVFRDATAPRPEALARLERSFSGRSTHARLALLPSPRLARAPVLRPQRPRWPVLVLATALLAWLVFRPAPRPLDARLDAVDTVTEALTSAVQLQYAGTGTVSGTERAPRIRWEVGELRVEVNPGIALSVETDEGLVTVLGTIFTVVRDARGTTVSVERGRVSVSCADHVLEPGMSATCLPRRPAGLLARARALRADRPGALDAVTRGLALAKPGDPIRGELLALQVQLLAPDDPQAARAAAQAYLDEGYLARQTFMRQFLGSEP